MRTRPIFILFVGLLAVGRGAIGQLAAEEVVVQSPDGNVQLKFTNDGGQLKATATMGGKAFVESSPIQFIIDDVDLSKGAELGKPQTYSLNEKYAWRGSHSEATNRCNGVTIPVKHAASNSNYTIEARAFNDAVAFRHVIEGTDKPRTPDEGTTLVIPAGSTVWHHDLSGHYEDQYTKSAGEEIKAGEWVAPPMTYKLPDGAGYAAITEAALVNYPGMALEADGQRGFKTRLGHSHPISHPYRLRYSPEDIERVSKPAQITGTITTPWRLVMVGKDLNAMVNSDAVSNLNPPPDKTLFPQGMQADWIRPGRAVWDYLDRTPGNDAQGGRRNPEESLKNMKEFTRQAHELGFEHNIMEGFWTGWTDDQIKEIVQYAKERNIDVWFWRSARGRGNFGGQNRGQGGGNRAGQNAPQNPTAQNPSQTPSGQTPGTQSGAAPTAPAGAQAQNQGGQNLDRQGPGGPGGGQGGNPGFRTPGPQSPYTSGSLFDPKIRREFLKHLHDLGVSGIKIDFLDHEAKEVIDLYQGILKDAAENHILVDFHGSNKPTGESRTWPNELTREAVRGMEARRLEDRATHGATLPFTRWLVGPAEYTPVHFGERMGNTTAAHQVASAAILSAPVLTYAANPATLLASPAVEMFKSIPSIWDQTIVLPPSEIGDLAVLARRKGDVWFLAVMNNPNAKSLQVPLSFLGAGKYDALVVKDTSSDASQMQVENTTVNQGDSMKIELSPGGGFIARFTKAAN